MNYLKPGYPKQRADERGVVVQYLFRGPTSYITSYAQAYAVKKIFEDGLPVATQSLERVGSSSLSELSIETWLIRGQPSNPQGGLPPVDDNPSTPLPKQTATAITVGDGGVEDEYPIYEISWSQLEKSLKQHPAFAAFTATQLSQLTLWDEEKNSAAKAAFQFYNKDENGAAVGAVQTLDSDQQLYAKLRLYGVEAYLDFAPVARMTSKFRGNTTPSTGDAGQKEGGDPFTGVPSGYEWLKIGDSSTKQGAGSDWLQVEEWQGSRKILIDKDELFLP